MPLTRPISVFLVLIDVLHVFVLLFVPIQMAHTFLDQQLSGCSEYQKLEDYRQQFTGAQTRVSVCQRSHLGHGPSYKILGLRTHTEK